MRLLWFQRKLKLCSQGTLTRVRTCLLAIPESMLQLSSIYFFRPSSLAHLCYHSRWTAILQTLAIWSVVSVVDGACCQRKPKNCFGSGEDRTRRSERILQSEIDKVHVAKVLPVRSSALPSCFATLGSSYNGRYNKYRRETHWIHQKYVYGGCIRRTNRSACARSC